MGDCDRGTRLTAKTPARMLAENWQTFLKLSVTELSFAGWIFNQF